MKQRPAWRTAVAIAAGAELHIRREVLPLVVHVAPGLRLSIVPQRNLAVGSDFDCAGSAQYRRRRRPKLAARGAANGRRAIARDGDPRIGVNESTSNLRNDAPASFGRPAVLQPPRTG